MEILPGHVNAVRSMGRAPAEVSAARLDSKGNLEKRPDPPNATREAFQDFVGQTFFAQMIESLRSTQQPSAYFHGGRAEEIFQGQFDQVLAEQLSDSSARQIADPMFELFMLGRAK